MAANASFRVFRIAVTPETGSRVDPPVNLVAGKIIAPMRHLTGILIGFPPGRLKLKSAAMALAAEVVLMTHGAGFSSRYGRPPVIISKVHIVIIFDKRECFIEWRMAVGAERTRFVRGHRVFFWNFRNGLKRSACI